LRSSVFNLRPAVLLDEGLDPELQSGALYDSLLKDIEGCDLFLVVGTSLKTNGILNLARDIAEKVHESEGAVIYIDSTELKKGSFKTCVDFHFQMDVQACMTAVMDKMDKVCYF
jgi:NAD-dependent SIR2 family protein deacetylase